jgi:hypothetical protein
MSHFPVLVIGPHENLEASLAPFQENNMGTCPRQYMEFYDEEDELLEKYNTSGTERVVMPDGSYKRPWDDEFRKPETFGIGSDTHEVPAHLETREVPYKELYPTFEEFVQGYHGHESRDEETGRYGHWENPNRKWDWYQVGGRWTGFFKLKKGATGELGRRGLFGHDAEPGYVDACRVGDIDVEGMRAEAVAEATERYDLFHSILAGRPFTNFEDLVAQHSGSYEAARRAYWSNPVMEDLRAASDKLGHFEYEQYLVDRDVFLEQARDSALVTFAVIKDGIWYEQGSMGWWGMVADEKDKGEWSRQFAALFDSLPPETEVAVVDCHI